MAAEPVGQWLIFVAYCLVLRSRAKWRQSKDGEWTDKHAGAARYRRVHQRTRSPHPRAANRAVATGGCLSASHRGTVTYGCGGPHRARTAANWQANRDWSRRRSVVGVAPDDRWSAALEGI